MWVKGYKIPMREIELSPGDLMHSIAIIVNNTVVHLKTEKRVDLKCTHYKKERKIM